MHIPSLLFAASMCMRTAYADFLILTEPPIPTTLIPSFANPTDAAKWTTSVGLNFKIQWRGYTNSLGDAWQSSVTSIQSEVKDFVASAPSNYSIPPAVTDPETTTTILGKPSWYTAMPTDVRSFKEAEYTAQKSVLERVVGNGQATATKTSSVGSPTGVVGIGAGWAMAAAAGAVFL
ncbi:hypothetical protein K505DRAFT_323697 [Melanomma pulvis-pyrius CBS 109.77]|uniref:Uncharacterized protein n=1 Tax=Melanomma pulvis-pyrius CBS 109.77 TaxID=1314802 RepID=A0A6A6XHJ5_9PLEO|nr:hypothetical protein K505DRAFT_323697 [Melanomma pulvis-pyrius CBS 109.77]